MLNYHSSHRRYIFLWSYIQNSNKKYIWKKKVICKMSVILSQPQWVRASPLITCNHVITEKDNLFPFDSKIVCLCQSIKISNTKHVYRQSQMRKPTSNGVEWAECLLIIGAGYWVQVFSLILDSSVGLSAGIQSAEDSVPETLGWNPAFNRGRQLVSF